MKGTRSVRKGKRRTVRKKARRQSASSGNARVRALVRAQQMNEMLKRSIVQSEALQSSGDDRPWGEDHISELLSEDSSGKRLYKEAESGLSRNASRRSSAPQRKKGRR